ncbi:MAG: secondary thiamine-phosphate synthase enzyme YjbQ [Syntrophobacteraceae bacterium]
MQTFQVKTSARSCAVDITSGVEAVLKEMAAQKGVCLVYVAHTTAALIINEGADSNVMEDVLDTLDTLVPWKGAYKHAEGNSAAHIKAILAGGSVQVIVDSGHMVLGTWQKIFLLDFDGPRTRKIFIHFTGDRTHEAL